MKGMLLAVTLVAVGACSTSSHVGKGGPAPLTTQMPKVPPGPRGAMKAVHDDLGAKIYDHNDATFVNNGEVFKAIERQVADAKSSIHVDLFIWSPCPECEDVARAIAAKAKQGVACRVLIDPFGSLGFSKKIAPILRDGGCQLREFNTIGSTPINKLTKRDHRKIIVIDGKVAITGGFGLDHEWQGNGRAKDEWRETNVVVAGPVVHELQNAFVQDWQNNGGTVTDDVYPKLVGEGDVRAAFVKSEGPSDSDDLSASEKVIRFMIGAATKRLWITNAYFVPSKEILEMLAKKAKQGVDVRVLVPGKHIDSRVVPFAEDASLRPLIAAGVKVYKYEASMIHAKTVLVDEDLVVVGSINLDPFSLKVSEEDAVVMQSAKLSRRAEADYLEDLKYSKQITQLAANPVDSGARHMLWMLGKHL